MMIFPSRRARARVAPRSPALLLVAAIAASLLVVPSAIAGPAPSAPPRLAADAARAIALREVPGHVVEEELDRERGRWVYELEIRADDGRLFEIEIDGDSGAIASIEEDDDDDRDDD